MWPLLASLLLISRLLVLVLLVFPDFLVVLAPGAAVAPRERR